MTLTTPIVNDFDNIFPGENWFFYWKTASSLWEEKLATTDDFDSIVIPLNWGFHSETGDKFDFGQDKPEANLVKLVEIIQKLNKKVSFLIPVGPAPYLANGGIPYLLAKEPSFYHQQVWLSLDGEKQMHKMFSFYEPKVFKGFQKFITTFKNYLVEQKLQVSVLGFSPFFAHASKIISYFEDSSPSYEQAFKRFLEGQGNKQITLKSIDEERIVHTEFRRNLKDLYEESFKEIIGEYWDGKLNICFLGGSPHNFVNRSFGKEDELGYFKDMLQVCALNMLPSTVLLGQERSELLQDVSKSYFVDILASEKINENFYEDDTPLIFSRLNLFSLFIQPGQHFQAIWQKSYSPLHLLEQRYQGTYLFLEHTKEKYQNVINDERNRSIHFFLAQYFDLDIFHSIIKLFMHGKQIIIDINNISETFARKLEAFFIENKLEVQKVNFHTIVRSVSLGDGQIILYSSQPLEVLDRKSINDFWQKILSLFTFKHPEVTGDNGVIEYWLERSPLNSELNFESIRRVTLCNVVSYKQKATIKFPKSFLVLKIVDEQNAKVKIDNGVLDIAFSSKGSVSIEFGFIDEY